MGSLFFYCIIGILGLSLGSFFNVCIYRLPRNLSIIRPASSCPHCRKKIKPWHNIPVISFLWLKGRCADCQKPIGLRYPFVEILSAIFFVFLVVHFDLFSLSWRNPLPIILVVFNFFLLLTFFIDLETFLIPDKITLPGIILGLASAFLPGELTPLQSLGGGLLGGGLLYLIGLLGEWILKKESMGGGDVKFLAMVGCFLGIKGVLLTLFLGSLVGTLVSLVGLSIGKIGWKGKISFGPFLALGTFFSEIWGDKIIEIYLRFSLFT